MEMMSSYNRLLSIYACLKYQNYYDITLLQFLLCKSTGNLKEWVAAITLLPKLLCIIKHASKAELKKLFEFATSGTYFLFSRCILRPNRWCCYGFTPWSCLG